jgi:hypothetical protein
MSWRRGELWLDADLLWFREVAGAPAVAGLAPAPARALGPPPGLTASRERRAAWRKRRYARRVRATALVLSPALLFPLAALRGGGGGGSHGTNALAEDPPSLTFHLGSGMVEPVARLEAAARPALPGRAGDDNVVAADGWLSTVDWERAHPGDAGAEAFPKIEWHHATSVGLPYYGRLIDGTQLPLEGPDWVTWDPVTDSVPNRPNRLYANEHTIHTIVSVIGAYRAANPDAPRVVIGDISFKGGGTMDEHASHQNGLDVDIYYPRRDGTLRQPLSPDEIDHRLAQDLLDRFVAAGAQMIFVGFSSGLHGPADVVIPYPNHENHMHVRFPPPGG